MRHPPLFPQAVPVITDPAQMAARPGLAALVLAFHGLVPGVLPAFLASMDALGDRGPAYYECGYCLSPAQVRRLLEEAVATGTWPVYSPFAKKHFGEGLAQGKAEGEIDGEREAIILFLKPPRCQRSAAHADPCLYRPGPAPALDPEGSHHHHHRRTVHLIRHLRDAEQVHGDTHTVSSKLGSRSVAIISRTVSRTSRVSW
jgi:hypothetical protein